MKYYCPTSFHFGDQPIRVAVVGVGGTGGEVIDALTRLDAGVRALGHSHGLEVTAYDDDIVETHNVGRQRFSRSDIGLHKAITLINRVNMFYGLTWKGVPRLFPADTAHWSKYDFVIGCTDKAKFRVDLARTRIKAGDKTHSARDSPVLWLDFGNGQVEGQAVLGHLRQGSDKYYLPNVFDLYQTLDDPELDKESGPRCSLAEALQGPDGQDLFINAALVKMGMNILWRLLTKGVLKSHGVHVNVREMVATPMEIDPIAWSFMGFESDPLPVD